MTRLFIYTTPFRNAWKAMGLNDADLVQLEEILLENPQKGFASILGVSSRTVEAWEAGKSNPSPTARNLIFLISQDHSLIHKLQTIYD